MKGEEKLMKSLIKIFTAAMFITKLTFSYINIYPLSFDKRIDGMGAIKDFILTNTTTKTVRYQIKIDKTNFENDMSRWTEIYPAVITLKPSQKGQVKMYTRAPKNAKEGEYKMVLNAKEMEVPRENGRDRKKLNVFTNLKINLYGYVGNLDSSISLRRVKAEIDSNSGLKLDGILKNTSLRRVNLEVIASDRKGKEQVLLSEFKLRADEEKELSELKLYSNDKKIDYSKLENIIVYEKEVGKELGKIKILKN